MITADTITDEQIRELRRVPVPFTGRDAAAIGGLCAIALGETESAIDEDGERADPDENEIENARARCAEILNARAASKAGAK